jgi:RNA polymerase sigma-70 factor (ECF subfamily)
MKDGAHAELLNETEFQDLYRAHGRPLWAYLYRLTGSASDADDLVQEAYCRLLATPMATREDASLRAYLFRIATNAATDLWRRGGRGTRRTEPVTSETASVGDHARAVALEHDMARTFRELKPQERTLLWLAHVEGNAHAEIADTLGLKAASVPVLLHRARRHLADLLRKKGFGPGER